MTPAKVRSEKQIAATERMRLAREEKKKSLIDGHNEVLEAEQRKADVKENARKLKKARADALKAEKLIVLKADGVEKSNKRKRKDGDMPDLNQLETPPKWFANYIGSVKTGENNVSETPVAKKALKEEIANVSQAKWNDEAVRGKAKSSVDAHMSKMYGEIFGR